MATVSVRYIVDDVDAAINFYREHLAFTLVMHPSPPFAMLERGDLRLLLSAPSRQGGGGQSMPAARTRIFFAIAAGRMESIRAGGVRPRGNSADPPRCRRAVPK